MRFEISELLEQVNCSDLAEYLGIEQVKKGKRIYIRCPEHVKNTGKEERKIDNCILSENGYHCFSCQAHGNAISLVRNFLEVDFKTACKEISKFMGCEDFFQGCNMEGDYMPFSSKELRLLDLKSAVYVEEPKEWTNYKMAEDDIPYEYKRLNYSHVLENGEPEYLYGEEERIMLNQLYKEEPEVFFWFLKGKLEEKEKLLCFLLDTDFLKVFDDRFDIPYLTYQARLQFQTERRECIQLRQKIAVLESRILRPDLMGMAM